MTAPERKLLLRALAGERTERVPIWLMRQAGRYLPEYLQVRKQAGGMLALCNSPELAAEVALQPIRRFQLDGSIVFADLPQIAAALGQTLEYREGDGPVLMPPIRTAEDVKRHLSLEHLHERLAPIYETIRRLSKALPAHVALIGYAGAPWTVATYMVEGRGGGANEHANVRQLAIGDADAFQALMDLVTEATLHYLVKQIEAGAEAIQLFESWAGILPEPFFRRWCVEPAKAIIEALHARYPDVPIVAFPRGAGLLYTYYARETQADAICIDSVVPVAWAAEHIQRGMGKCVQGNLEPLALVAGGQVMRSEVERILSVLGGGPFVFNLGHGIVQQTPPVHVEELVRQVRNWSG